MTEDFVSIRAVLDPRGEVAVGVFQQTRGERLYGWSYPGIVGRASVGRLLSPSRMREEPAIQGGDAESYGALATKNRARVEALTEYFAGRGLRPGRSLP